MQKITFFLITVFFISINGVNAQSRVYVDHTATDQNTGVSWANAYTNLQTAIDNSNTTDTLWVAKGLYYPTKTLGSSTDKRSKSFQLKNNTFLYGGFDGTETALNQRIISNQTVLSGDLGVANDTSDNAYHVLVGLSTTGIIDQISVTNGNASGSGTDIVSGFNVDKSLGGGVYLDRSDVAFNRCNIQVNYAKIGGGGIYNNAGSPTIKFCSLNDNAVYGSDTDIGGGGALYNIGGNPILKNVQFRTNLSFDAQGGGAIRNENGGGQMDSLIFYQNVTTNGDGGGAMYNLNSNPTLNFVEFDANTTNKEAGAMYNDGSIPIINDVIFKNNSSTVAGGAMENDGGSDAVLNRVQFLNNTSLGDGGAIHNWKSSIDLNNVTFLMNSTGGDGGAIKNYNNSSPTFTNVTFQENESTGNGGAIYNERNSNPIITNTLIIRNKAGAKGGGIYVVSGAAPCSPVLTNVTIANNIALTSGGGVFDDGLGSSRLRNSIIHGNTAPTNPDFEAPLTMLTTAIFHDILGDEYYVNGSNLPVPFTDLIFVDSANNIFHLANPGPGIDKGDISYYAANLTPNLSSIVTDIRGAARNMGVNVDLGAFEDCDFSVTPTVSLSADPSFPILNNTGVTLTATATHQGATPQYKWYVNGTLIATSKDSTYTVIAGVDFTNGDYISVVLVTSIVCASGTPSDTILTKINYLGITDFELSENDLAISPNPNNGVFKIKTTLAVGENYQVRLLDVKGTLVFETTIKSAKKSFEMELNLGGQLESGIYILVVSNTKDLKQLGKIVVY